MMLVDILQLSCKVFLCLRMDGTTVTRHSLQLDIECSLHLECGKQFHSLNKEYSRGRTHNEQ